MDGSMTFQTIPLYSCLVDTKLNRAFVRQVLCCQTKSSTKSIEPNTASVQQNLKPSDRVLRLLPLWSLGLTSATILREGDSLDRTHWPKFLACGCRVLYSLAIWQLRSITVITLLSKPVASYRYCLATVLPITIVVLARDERMLRYRVHKRPITKIEVWQGPFKQDCCYRIKIRQNYLDRVEFDDRVAVAE